MAQFLVPELLAELGFALAEVGETLGLSSTAAGAVGGAAVAQVSSSINEGLKGIGEFLVGEENLATIQGSLDKLIRQSKGAYNRDPMAFLQDIKRKKEGPGIKEFGDFQMPKEQISPKDIASFVVDFSSNIAGQAFDGNVLDPEKALVETVGTNDTRIKLAQVLGTGLADKIPSNEEYKKIANVYNGLDMYNDSRSIQMFRDPSSKLIYFELIDELKEKTTMFETTGIYIPAIHGVFMGAQSRNNNLPVDLVDLYSAFHDESYINGPNLEGDYKYISRLSQNFYRLSESEKPFARLGIVYFSTMGNLITKMFGNTDVQDPTQKITGIYDFIVPELTKEEFEDELITNIAVLHKEESIISANSSSFKNKVLYKEFGNIFIELL